MNPRREDGAEDQSGGDQGELLENIADGIVIAEIQKSPGHPEERENRVDNREGKSASTCGASEEECDPPGEFNARGEIGERHAQRDVGANILPGGGEVTGDQAQNAEKDGSPGIDIEPEI
jgi:hypothetical protein